MKDDENMIKNWVFDEADEMVFREIKDFIPGKVFDVHAHVYRLKDLNMRGSAFFNEGPEEVGVKELCGRMDEILGPGRLKGSFLIAFPTKEGDMDTVNDYVVRQLDLDSESVGSICIAPDYPVEKVHAYLKNDRIRGLRFFRD